MRSCLKPSSLHKPRHRGIRDDPAFYTREYIAISLLLTGKFDDVKGLRLLNPVCLMLSSAALRKSGMRLSEAAGLAKEKAPSEGAYH